MNESGIEWTQVTWNPASGCEAVSEGCKFCYAETLAERRRDTPAFPNGFDLTLRPHKLEEPYRLSEPSLVFVNSMSDLFWPEIPDSYRRRIFAVMRDTPQHQYQVLTKRPVAMARWARAHGLPSNFWAGVTVESNRVVERVDVLRDVEADIRFISAEPLLSPLPDLELRGIQWLIAGGESGNHLWTDRLRQRRGLVDYVDGEWRPREERKRWIRELRDACRRAGVAFFFKQWGGPHPKAAGAELDGERWTELPREPAGPDARQLPLA